MRIYLPATLDEIAHGDLVLPGRIGYGITPELVDTYPDEDDEGLEFVAQQTAAMACLMLLAAQPGSAPLRVVVAVDIRPDQLVEPVSALSAQELVAAAVGRTADLVVGGAACFLVDEPSAAELVAAVVADPERIEELEGCDLLWYDVTEAGRIPQ